MYESRIISKLEQVKELILLEPKASQFEVIALDQVSELLSNYKRRLKNK